MNITEAKKIPLAAIVEKLNGRFSHADRQGFLWYFSPFRPDEKTASFKIDTEKNTWHDFGLALTQAHRNQGNGGDTLDLWCDYNLKDRRTGIPAALSAFDQMLGNGGHITVFRDEGKVFKQPKEPRYKIIKIFNRITAFGLKNELTRRKISIKLADIYLKQAYILDTDTNKEYTGFLFENDKGGYEVSIPNPRRQECFKTCIGPKASSRIMAKDDVEKADVFEGFWDMLSWLEMKAVVHPIHHTYVLNSVSMVAEVCDNISAFSDSINSVFLFMDNDDAGYQATHGIAERLTEDFKIGSREHIYAGTKDLSEFRMNGLSADV